MCWVYKQERNHLAAVELCAEMTSYTMEPYTSQEMNLYILILIVYIYISYNKHHIYILADIHLEHIFSKMEIPLLRTSSLEHPVQAHLEHGPQALLEQEKTAHLEHHMYIYTIHSYYIYIYYT